MSEFPDRPTIPPGFLEVYGPQERFGAIHLGIREDPMILWITVRGWISAASWQRALAHAYAFGRARPQGWSLVVDSEGAFTFSASLFALPRKLSRLPHLRRRIVFHPDGRRGLQERLTSGLPRPDALEKRLDAVFARAREDRQQRAA